MLTEGPYRLPWTWRDLEGYEPTEVILSLSCGHERPMDISERLWDPLAACTQCPLPAEEQAAFPVCKVVERFVTQAWVFEF